MIPKRYFRAVKTTFYIGFVLTFTQFVLYSSGIYDLKRSRLTSKQKDTHNRRFLAVEENDFHKYARDDDINNLDTNNGIGPSEHDHVKSFVGEDEKGDDKPLKKPIQDTDKAISNLLKRVKTNDGVESKDNEIPRVSQRENEKRQNDNYEPIREGRRGLLINPSKRQGSKRKNELATQFRLMQQKRGMQRFEYMMKKAIEAPFQIRKSFNNPKYANSEIYEPNWEEVEPKIKEFVQSFTKTCEAKYAGLSFGKEDKNCPCVPDGLTGHVTINQSDISWDELSASLPNIEDGGVFIPKQCESLQRVAIIIPYRDRESHLRILLRHLHPILQRQQLHYRIFVIEQVEPAIFNRAAMMNIGYVEAKNMFDPDCTVFHDVDLIPMDDRHFYMCQEEPLHHSSGMNKHGYKMPYADFFGGVVSAPDTVFEEANGWPNSYYGWGGEDDDMAYRFNATNHKILRYPDFISYYTMVLHTSDATNPVNPFREDAYNRHMVRIRQKTDGLNSLDYKVVSNENHPLFTHIKAIPDSPFLNYSTRNTSGICNDNVLKMLSLSEPNCAKECSKIGNICQGFAFDHNAPINPRINYRFSAPCTIFYDKCEHMGKTKHGVVFYDKKVWEKNNQTARIQELKRQLNANKAKQFVGGDYYKNRNTHPDHSLVKFRAKFSTACQDTANYALQYGVLQMGEEGCANVCDSFENCVAFEVISEQDRTVCKLRSHICTRLMFSASTRYFQRRFIAS